MKKRILTVSSANMDFVMNVTRVPEAGETLLDNGTFRFVPGGKGANAAVAVQRLGGDSVFCTRLGNDRNGAELRAIYAREGIDCRFIVTDPAKATGLAAIAVEPSGQNRITVFPGANTAICGDDIESAMLCRPDALFMQLEIAPDEYVPDEYGKLQPENNCGFAFACVLSATGTNGSVSINCSDNDIEEKLKNPLEFSEKICR